MDSCRHILGFSPASEHSVLNPQQWHCSVCATTESVWACLSCTHVACGRYIEEHAIKHYKETKHPLAMEVNDKYVFCYECDDYVLNDNEAGDMKLLRCCLSALTTQSFQGVPAKKGRLLRSYSYNPGYTLSYSDSQFRDDDLTSTALWFRRYYLLAKVFTSWRKWTLEKKPTLSSRLAQLEAQGGGLRRRPMLPGVTGLRNLGNTCYMNSVLQVLSHLTTLRDHFKTLTVQQSDASRKAMPEPKQKIQAIDADKHRLMRQTTMECYEYLSAGQSGVSVVLGRAGPSGATNKPKTSRTSATILRKPLSLSEELHALLRVMWSGKWAIISPHKMLYAIWHLIPFFKGYFQQDAQEFMCEFLGMVQSEMEKMMMNSKQTRTPDKQDNDHNGVTSIIQDSQKLEDIVSRMFKGEIISQVTCVTCGHQSQTTEPFMDLSLEFPRRYQVNSALSYNTYARLTEKPCHIKEMLEIFTESEKLEGKIYACEKCNSKRPARRSRGTVYSEVEKQILLRKLPYVLRLHLKRFMWSGRNDRGKIGVMVDFDSELDMGPYCCPGLGRCVYRLSAVIIHHGRGFGSGHYSSYCWNQEAGSWVHCNDAQMKLCSESEVRACQAYILVYTRHHNTPSSVNKFTTHKRKVNADQPRHLKRTKTTRW